MTLLLGFSMALLAGGTFAFRYFGSVLDQHFKGFRRYEALLNDMGIILLTSVVAVSTIYSAGEWTGWARCCGVLVAGLMAYYRINILGILLTSVVVTAGLRLLGVA